MKKALLLPRIRNWPHRQVVVTSVATLMLCAGAFAADVTEKISLLTRTNQVNEADDVIINSTNGTSATKYSTRRSSVAALFTGRNGSGLTNLPGILNVKDFGAIGNGTADDTAAISNALYRASLATSGSWVYVPAGTYKFTTNVFIWSNTRLTLDPGATIVRGAAIDNLLRNFSDGSVGLWGASSNIVVEGGRWDGNKDTFSSASTLIAFGHSYGVTIRNATFVNGPSTWHCIELNSTRQASISDCTFSNAPNQECIQIDICADVGAFPWFGPFDSTECSSIQIQHCLFDTFFAGIASHRWAAGHMHNAITIRDCTFTNFTATAIAPYNWSGGVVIDGNFATLGYRFVDPDLVVSPPDPGFVRYDWKIINNRIINMTSDAAQGRAIKVQFVEDVLIANNFIKGVARHAIGVDWYARNITIVNNTIQDVGQLAGTGRGIFVYGACGVVVSGNSISNCVDAGITIGNPTAGNTSTNVIVTGNILPTDSINLNTCSNVLVWGNRSIGPATNETASANSFNDANGPLANTAYAGDASALTNLVSGAVTNKVVSQAANYNVAATDSIVLLAGNKTATLPTAVGIPGREFVIACSSAGTNAILSTSSQTFLGYGNTAAVKWTNSVVGRSTTVVSDGANWIVTKSDN